MLRVINNEKCWQCEETKEQIVDIMFNDGGQFRVCEECLDKFIEGEIKTVDAMDVAE